MQTIDIISFLRNFYGIVNSSLKFSKLSHSDIKILFPNIKRCGFQNVTVDELKNGNIIGVYDKSNTIIYYYNPHIIINEMMDIVDNDAIIKENYDINDINNLSKDELLKLRRKLRLLELRKEATILTSLIRKKKKEEPKNYRMKKEKLKIKERFEDD